MFSRSIIAGILLVSEDFDGFGLIYTVGMSVAGALHCSSEVQHLLVHLVEFWHMLLKRWTE